MATSKLLRVWAMVLATMLVACGGGGSDTSIPKSVTVTATGRGLLGEFATQSALGCRMFPASCESIDAVASIDSVAQVNNPDTQTYAFGALTAPASGPTGFVGRPLTSLLVPYADQRKDGCKDTGHCAHTTMLMAAAALNPAAVQRIPGCAGPIVSPLSESCIRAAQDLIENDETRTDVPDPLTTTAANREKCGSVQKDGPLTRACGCAVPADVMRNIAQRTFGMKSAVLLNRSLAGESDSAARQFTRTNLSNLLASGCLAGINVQAQDSAAANAHAMATYPGRGGHWMLLIDQTTDAAGRASSYVVNDPFYWGSQATGAGVSYAAESVLDLVVTWNRSPPRGVATTVVAFCPATGPKLLVGQFNFPTLQVNKRTDGFRLKSDPFGATFKLVSGGLPPGMQLASDGTITGTPSATGNYVFSVNATYHFASSLDGSATQKFQIDVVGTAAPLQVSFKGDLENASLGDTVQRDMSNWVNKAVTWSTDSAGGAVQIVDQNLIVNVQSNNDIYFNLIAQSGDERATIPMHLKVVPRGPISNPAPVAKAIVPANPISSSELQAISIMGTGFVAGASVEFTRPDGYVFPPQAVTQLAPDALTTNMNFDLKSGLWHAAVINADGKHSNVLEFQVQPQSSPQPAPSVTGVEPSPVPGVNGPQRFLVTGSGFRAGANVMLRDKTGGGVYPNRAISFLQPASIEIAPNFTNSSAQWTVEVVNIDGKSSGEFVFSVVEQASQLQGPVVLGVDPAAPSPSSQTRSINISGRNFAAGATAVLRDLTSNVLISNAGAIWASSSQMTVSSVFATARHTWSVEVINPDGQSSGQYSFTVAGPVAATPSISSVSPNPVTGSNSAQPFTIYGSNFVSGANVTLRDLTAGQIFANRPASSFGSNQITVNPTFTTAAHSWSVEVINPDGQSSGQYSFMVR